MNEICKKFIESWITLDGVNTFEDIFSWIKELNETTFVKIDECSIKDNDFWFYDDYNGEVLNRKRSFFFIKGVRRFEDDMFVSEQPIIFQPEIGYLGIICSEIGGILHFLMQAKIEPGNVNCVQISPTIQATKSNFTRAHGGKLPLYFEYFEHSDRYDVIYDQIQSEQATRFYKKRNRNMILHIEENINVYSNFKWMTLGQIKKLMKIDNLVNMDTRTVLSGIPFITTYTCDKEKDCLHDHFNDRELFSSIFDTDVQYYLPKLYNKLNNYKMFKDVRLVPVPLNELADWKVDDYGITCRKKADFMVRYFDINISGREVQRWSQPLFKAIGMATFAMLTRVVDGKREYLVKIKPEIASFDKAEIGPAIQWEPSHSSKNDIVEDLFLCKYNEYKGIVVDVILSEEGGRFYHEQNRNVIVNIDYKELTSIPDEYLWVSYSTLNYLVQVNNCLNIQLRNLISLIDI